MFFGVHFLSWLSCWTLEAQLLKTWLIEANMTGLLLRCWLFFLCNRDMFCTEELPVCTLLELYFAHISYFLHVWAFFCTSELFSVCLDQLWAVAVELLLALVDFVTLKIEEMKVEEKQDNDDFYEKGDECWKMVMGVMNNNGALTNCLTEGAD